MQNVIDCNEMLLNTFNTLERENFEKNNQIFQVWKKIVTSIKNDGQKIYEHSNVVDLKNNVLLVEADHSGWIQMLQLNSHYILNGFKMYAKDLKIQSIAFRLKGSGAKLYNLNYDSVYQKEQKKNSEKIAETERILSKYDKKQEISPEKNEIPENLLKKFESLKKSVLTKNKN